MDFTEDVLVPFFHTPASVDDLLMISPFGLPLLPVGGGDVSLFLPVRNDLYINKTSFGGLDSSVDFLDVNRRFLFSSAAGFDFLTGQMLEQNEAGEVVFVDSGVENYQSLLAGVDRNAEVFILNSTGNQLEEMTEILSHRQNVSAVHIVSHGSAGALSLGDSSVSIADISQTELWRGSLTADADVLLYGCDVAAGDVGKEFVKELSELTSADVAASTDKTGFGGNWDFEYKTGNIETGLIFSKPVRDNYQSSLAIITSIGQSSIASGTTVGGTIVGGLSGITYDSVNNQYYIISDGRNSTGSPGAARFYTGTINLTGDTLAAGGWTINAVRTIGNPTPTFAANTTDTEGIALLGSSVYISSEGIFTSGNPTSQPFINEFNISTGNQISALTIPAKFTATNTTSGIVGNAAFESLTISPSGIFLFTATENALKQEVAAPTATTGTPSRILTYDLTTNSAAAEYVYNTDAGNGISEILAIDNTNLLVLERSMNPSVGGSLKLYQVSLNNATDVSGLNSLIGNSYTPVQKTLIANFQTAGFPIANFEGMTFGPNLSNGKRSLLLLSDNNFLPALDSTVAAFSVNSAPVLDNTGTPTLTAINEDVANASNPGTLISSIIGSSITDADVNDQKGIALTGIDSSNGTWQYSTDGTNWNNFSTVSESAAVLLASDVNTRIRFIPNANYNGTANITYRAWDQTIETNGSVLDVATNGIGGLTSFSTALETASITINAVNDAPALSLPASQTVNQNTNLSISGISVSDIDAGTGNLQVTLSVSNGFLTLNSFDGLAFSTGDGTADSTMTFTGSLTNINNALTGLTYVSSGNFVGADAINLSVNDLGNTGGGVLTASGSITVNVAGMPYAASSVVINEVVTSPQQDWSLSSFINPIPGGTPGANDEWVELYINQAGLNLTGWTIELNDASPLVGSLAQGGAFGTSRYISSGGGSFSNTAVGDYLILGTVNGGAINNIITLVLKDHTGTIIDQVSFTNGAASGVIDEAVARVPNASDTDNDTTDLRKQAATLGTSNNIGQLVLGEHPVGQITDQFTTTQTSNVLHRFNLTASNENINVGSLTFTVSPTGILNSDISGLQLVQDVNNNGIQDGGDVVVGTVESPLNLADGLTFANLTVPVGSNNYLFVANVNNLVAGDRLSFGLANAGIINNFGVISGLQIADTGTVTSTVHTVDVAALSVVINEIAWMGTQANATDEWIELFNPTANAINLTGWTIQTGTGTTITITNGVIAAGGYFLLERTADTTVNSIPANFVYTGGLNNTTGTSLILRSSEGTIIDSANENGGVWPAGSNAATNARFTMERLDPTSPDIDSNWRTNNGITRNGTDALGNNIFGTPSTQNSAYTTPGVVITESGGSTVLTEDGVTDSYTVVLQTPVTAPVTVNLTNVGGQTLTTPTSLIFDNTNWNVAQTVTVTAVDDTTAEGTHTGTIQHTVTSTDSRYNGMAVNSISASITDNDSNPPVINLTPESLSYTENSGGVVVDSGATVSDSDSADFNGGVLTVQFSGATGLGEDSLSIQNVGNSAGQIGVTGSTISYGGVAIGTFSGGNNGSTPLVVNFNANANVTAVSALLQNIVYLNNSENPSALSRTVQFQMTDGDNGVGLAVNKTINVVPVNDAPSISSITAQTINEDTATGTISFTIGDIETLPDSLILSATSSNTSLIPNSNIVFAGSGNNRTVSLTPAGNQNGTATI
ncbi:MAG TPA: esterase-like activity of phytase family protein, partial [Halomicronema sp.]